MTDVAIPAGMKAWAGGDSAPEDWDGGPVWVSDGGFHRLAHTPATFWGRGSETYCDIIAYTPRTPTDAPDIAGLIARLRHLHETASPAPWRTGEEQYGRPDQLYAGEKTCVAQFLLTGPYRVAPGKRLKQPTAGPHDAANRALVREMRNLLPEIIAAFARLAAPQPTIADAGASVPPSGEAAAHPAHQLADLLDYFGEGIVEPGDTPPIVPAMTEDVGAASQDAAAGEDVDATTGFASWLREYVGQQDANAMRFSAAELEIAYAAGLKAGREEGAGESAAGYIARLEEALKPFAEAYDFFGPGRHGQVHPDDLKRAYYLSQGLC